MSIELKGGLWALLAIIVLCILQMKLWQSAKKRASAEAFETKEKEREVVFFDLIVMSGDEHYSLSRLQMYLWTVAVAIVYSAILLTTWKFPNIPETLYLLMGVNLTTTVLATAMPAKKEGNGKPDFIKDIFFESKTSLDLPRTQMFVWTIISLGAFILMSIESFKSGNPKLPDIPSGLVALMGISNGAYLGIKKLTDNK